MYILHFFNFYNKKSINLKHTFSVGDAATRGENTGLKRGKANNVLAIPMLCGL